MKTSLEMAIEELKGKVTSPLSEDELEKLALKYVPGLGTRWEEDFKEGFRACEKLFSYEEPTIPKCEILRKACTE